MVIMKKGFLVYIVLKKFENLVLFILLDLYRVLKMFFKWEEFENVGF